MGDSDVVGASSLKIYTHTHPIIVASTADLLDIAIFRLLCAGSNLSYTCCWWVRESERICCDFWYQTCLMSDLSPRFENISIICSRVCLLLAGSVVDVLSAPSHFRYNLSLKWICIWREQILAQTCILSLAHTRWLCHLAYAALCVSWKIGLRAEPVARRLLCHIWCLFFFSSSSSCSLSTVVHYINEVF